MHLHTALLTSRSVKLTVLGFLLCCCFLALVGCRDAESGSKPRTHSMVQRMTKAECLSTCPTTTDQRYGCEVVEDLGFVCIYDCKGIAGCCNSSLDCPEGSVCNHSALDVALFGRSTMQAAELPELRCIKEDFGAASARSPTGSTP